MDLPPQHLDAETVDGAYEVVDVGGVNHVGDARLHLAGRLVGKSHAQDVGRVDAHLIDQVGITVGEDAGLSRSCAGHDAHPAFRGAYRFGLFVV